MLLTALRNGGYSCSACPASTSFDATFPKAWVDICSHWPGLPPTNQLSTRHVSIVRSSQPVPNIHFSPKLPTSTTVIQASTIMSAAVFWHIASPDQPIVSLVLPPKLFYVRHGYSQAYKTEDGGFISRNPSRKIWKEEDLKINATQHFGWSNWDYDSCFISVFGDQHHAEKWANRPKLTQPVMIYEVDTSKLPPGTIVLNAYMLCENLGIEHNYNENMDEFLFYQGIPGCCVGGCWDRHPWNWGARPKSPYCRYIYQIPWSSVITVAEWQQTEYKVQLQLANSQRDEAADQEPGAEEYYQESADNDANSVPDEEVNDLVGQMGSLDLQTTIDAEANNTSANIVPNITTHTASSSSGAGATVTEPRKLRSAGSIRRERRRKRELEELERERQKAAELETNTLHNAQDAHLPPSNFAEVERNEESELGEAVHTHSGSDASPKPDSNTELDNDRTIAPHTTPSPRATVTEPTTGATHISTATIATEFLTLYERKQREAEQILIERDVLLDWLDEEEAGSHGTEWDEWQGE